MPDEGAREARDLLAAEWEADGFAGVAEHLRSDAEVRDYGSVRALRAIEKALSRTPPVSDRDGEVERVARAIQQALLNDPDTDAYMHRDDEPDFCLIDGCVNLVVAARAVLAALPTERVERLKEALERQMEAMSDEDAALPSSVHREAGRVWLEGWFDLSAALASLPTARAEGVGDFYPVSTWEPSDELVLLLVDYSDDGDHALEDADVGVTIGHNNDHNVGEGEGQGWQFAGWCWTHDHYVEGKGKVIGWLPITSSRALASLQHEGGGRG